MTVVELMIVVSIIGLLSVIAIPAFTRARRASQDATFLNDIRRLSDDMFNLYALDNGDFPSDAPEGTQPAGVETYMPKRFSFSESTPIGGAYDWDRAESRSAKIHDDLCYAGLAIVEPDRTESQMTELDSRIGDDGDLSTGRFRSVGAGTYVLIFER